MLRKRKMALISQWKSLLENVLLNIWGRSAKGSSPISARLYGGLQTHGIHSKDHAIMDRAWNTFTQRILDPFHPSYTWYNEISTESIPLSSFFAIFKRNDNLCTDHRPFLSFLRFKFFSRWLESQECHHPNFSRFSLLPIAEPPLSFVQRNSSQCLCQQFLLDLPIITTYREI